MAKSESTSIVNPKKYMMMQVPISDIGMADTDGYNLIKQVRNDAQVGQIPAIALTAYARAQERIRAIAAGYNTHVAKPVEIGELVTVVKCLTGRIS